MNGPQRTAVSRKEFCQKWKQKEFLIITPLEMCGHRDPGRKPDGNRTETGRTISKSYSRETIITFFSAHLRESSIVLSLWLGAVKLIIPTYMHYLLQQTLPSVRTFPSIFHRNALLMQVCIQIIL